jgi:fatty-acyl-CoA synthase
VAVAPSGPLRRPAWWDPHRRSAKQTAAFENAVGAHPSVAEIGVIGVPDDRWGETVKAVVVRVLGSEVTAQELIAFTRQRLAGFKCPTSVDFVAALPRTPSGKILKRELREPYWAGRGRHVN